MDPPNLPLAPSSRRQMLQDYGMKITFMKDLSIIKKESKTADSLLLYAPCKRLQYEKQTKILDSFRLLLLELLHGGEIFKNEEEVDISPHNVRQVNSWFSQL